LFAEHFTLLLQVFGLLLQFELFLALDGIPFLTLALDIVHFGCQFGSNGFSQTITFRLQSLLDLLDTLGMNLFQFGRAIDQATTFFVQ
jgi:hypothetical protein